MVRFRTGALTTASAEARGGSMAGRTVVATTGFGATCFEQTFEMPLEFQNLRRVMLR
jgi:hypothetical protein